MDNRTKIQEVLTLAKKEMRTAENKFNKAVEKVQDKANSTIININNMSIALEIVAELKIATDELYISYESIVRMIDEGCRPLLSEDTYKSTIKSVADLIKKINNESSNLSSNIGGSFDGLNLGDLRSEHYIASLDAKAIEKFWSLKYTTAVETEAEMVENKKKAEKGEKEKRQKEEEKARKREIELQRKKEMENQQKKQQAEDVRLLEEAYEARAKNHAHKKEISTECMEKVAQFQKALNGQVSKKISEIQTRLKQEEQELKDTLERYRHELAATGLFKFSRKKELKENIEELCGKLNAYEAGEKFMQQNKYLNDTAKVAVQDYKKSVENFLLKRFPEPKASLQEYHVIKRILECLEQGEQDQKDVVSYVSGSSKATVIKALKEMAKEGLVYISDMPERSAFNVHDKARGKQLISSSNATMQHKNIGLIVFDLLTNKPPMTLGEMNEAHKDLRKLSIIEISKIVSSFVNIGVFNRVTRPATTTYSLLGSVQRRTDYLTDSAKRMADAIAHEHEENPEYAKMACPEPPSVESVFSKYIINSK